MRIHRYVGVYILAALGFFAFYFEGAMSYAVIIYTFGLVPLLDLFFRPDHSNLSEEQQKAIQKEPVYDWLLYLVVPLLYGNLILFFYQQYNFEGSVSERIGLIFSMGILCGVLGINVGHELGHRKSKFEQSLAKSLLLTSLYMHFFIEHNRGHHRYVATPEDCSTARFGESLYAFWWRSIISTYLKAWKLENERLDRLGINRLSLKNEMIRFSLIQLVLVVLIFLFLGTGVFLAFLSAALIGVLLLETVNYIEHYGLLRERKGNTYERVKPWHSWNSDHLIGRTVLFELPRHSDHHYLASKKYQSLVFHSDSPQLPTGYPGTMLLALVPPLWFYVMNPRVRAIRPLAAA